MDSYSPICPYLSGTFEGARCRIEDVFIRDVTEADIHVCMSERCEYCPILRCYNAEEAHAQAL